MTRPSRNKSKLKRIKERESQLLSMIDSLNAWVGSWTFLIFHAIWFTLWLMWDLDINLLTMVVSLEAIILMILLLMATKSGLPPPTSPI